MSSLARSLGWWRFLVGRGRGDGRGGVCAGATYARINEAHVMETAYVLSVQARGVSVPHVRYNCRLHNANRVFDDGPRTLALPTFLARFERAA